MPKANPINGLTPMQEAFCQYFIQTGRAYEAYIKAGYKETKGAMQNCSRLLTNDKVAREIARIRNEVFQRNVATSEEVMDFFTRVMRGEVKDQFGLETSVADRIKAGQELAKRTIDLDIRAQGLGEPVIEIKLDWSRSPIEVTGELTDIDGEP